MLLNSFYTLTHLALNTNGLQATLQINAGHDIFKGHFPAQPVVPGVCMVQIVKELMEQATGTPLVFRKGHQLKFLQLLVPGAEPVQVQINWQLENDAYNTQADFKKEAAAVFKLSGIFSV